jgi:hypothetical protein
MNKCPAGHYIDNIVVLHGALLCCGGLGVERCKHYETCLNDHGIRLSKNGRRIRIRKVGK